MNNSKQSGNGEMLVLRILWMLIFFGIWHLAAPILAVIVILQVIYRIILGYPSSSLMSFGDSLSQYLSAIGRFSSFSTEEKPWPVADWPQSHLEQDDAQASSSDSQP
ncbi:DUF4389 domain-containing protein [Pseudomonas sp. F1_0610]|uniref:DUF4389 domain-containing protein n=1 Tax=Pseudomonas sp. F1_0610 TaxID=3114284 RepID=UPI0039C36F56